MIMEHNHIILTEGAVVPFWSVVWDVEAGGCVVIDVLTNCVRVTLLAAPHSPTKQDGVVH